MENEIGSKGQGYLGLLSAYNGLTKFPFHTPGDQRLNSNSAQGHSSCKLADSCPDDYRTHVTKRNATLTACSAIWSARSWGAHSDVLMTTGLTLWRIAFHAVFFPSDPLAASHFTIFRSRTKMA